MAEHEREKPREAPGVELLESHAARLMEHFDSVQIVATRFSGESQETDVFRAGGGNYYARLGSMKEWLINEEERLRLDVDDSSFDDDDDEECELESCGDD